MGFLDILAVLLWPMIAVGHGLFFLGANRRIHLSKIARQAILLAGIAMSLGSVVAFLLLNSRHLAFVPDFELGLIVLGAVLVIWHFRHRRDYSRFAVSSLTRGIGDRFPARRKAVALAERGISSVLGLCFVVLGSWLFVGDFMLPRGYTMGIADRAATTTTGYTLYVSGSRFSITQDLLDATKIGDRVWVEYGRGSRTIFKIRPLNAPSG